jgi:hypothetical protein
VRILLGNVVVGNVTYACTQIEHTEYTCAEGEVHKKQ